MSAEVQRQFYLLFLAALWGVGMGFIYDALRILRYFIRHSTAWVNLEDIVYWAAMTVLLFRRLMRYNRGEIRSFTLVGLIVGSIFYLNAISPVYRAFMCRLLYPIFRLFTRISSILKKIFRKNTE
jgi:spore cortex biosynthesis protein YabQ